MFLQFLSFLEDIRYSLNNWILCQPKDKINCCVEIKVYCPRHRFILEQTMNDNELVVEIKMFSLYGQKYMYLLSDYVWSLRYLLCKVQCILFSKVMMQSYGVFLYHLLATGVHKFPLHFVFKIQILFILSDFTNIKFNKNLKTHLHNKNILKTGIKK